VLDHCVQEGFIDGNLARVKQADQLCVMIGANYLVADGCQATARDEPNVTAADDGDAQKYTPMDRFNALTEEIIPIRLSFEQIAFEKQYAGIKLEV
jgi:hypothetical protein